VSFSMALYGIIYSKWNYKMSLRHPQNPVITHGMISNTITNIFDEELHAKRVLSMANAVQGVLQGASLAIHTIGHGCQSLKVPQVNMPSSKSIGY
jgi:hypothetical protein